MEIFIIKEKISEEMFEKIKVEWPAVIKLVVDVEREILSLGCSLHIDCYEKLLEEGSQPEDLWGANFYPSDKGIDFISLVNIKPPHNRAMEITDVRTKNRVESVIKKLFF